MISASVYNFMSFGIITHCLQPILLHMLSAEDDIYDTSQEFVNNQTCIGSAFYFEFVNIEQKANQLIGLIECQSNIWAHLAMYILMLQTLYTGLVCPHLLYACVVWCPWEI